MSTGTVKQIASLNVAFKKHKISAPKTLKAVKQHAQQKHKKMSKSWTKHNQLKRKLPNRRWLEEVLRQPMG